ncbi:transposase [Saccharopolyspora sp. MS10]|uniref:transposase n=1 Tax=Saccharopolyspora sp. MS10 TaxID=3385973 RepID=UPI0039A030D9
MARRRALRIGRLIRPTGGECGTGRDPVSFDQLREVLLAELEAAGRIGSSRACVDASHVRAKGRSAAGPSPAEGGKTGSKHHLVCGGGVPLAVTLTGGNRDDITQLVLLVDAVSRVRGCPRPPRPTAPPTGGPRRRPGLRPRHISEPAGAARNAAFDQPSWHPGRQPAGAPGR